MGEIGAPGVTRTPGPQFRKLLSVVEVLDISTAASGLAGPRRAWTAAAASETRGRSSGLGDSSVRRFLLENSRSTEDRRKEELLESFEGHRAAFRLGLKDGALQG